MDIYWQGHSCFRIRGKDATVVIDPFQPDIGYQLGQFEADVVVVTHQHPGHNYVEGIQGEPKQVTSPGEYEIMNVFIVGIGTFHDDQKGELRGSNTAYLIEMEGVSICHLGDLGHLPTSQMFAELGSVDVLMLPVGGASTIDAAGAAEVMRRLGPKVVIPMHYKTGALSRELEPVDRFLKETGVNEVSSQPKLSFTKASLPASTQVFLLDY